ncbi:hypothetical protein T459_33904 [Capsicum annuum]|uniref:Uncharacterized protein n=1 Tax=Capsicum annuum TaxID=4072 RepID=A0A2G2XXP3_CAPAN|nr:hypothetical protein T459_33904 [Capsicum annuum]
MDRERRKRKNLENERLEKEQEDDDDEEEENEEEKIEKFFALIRSTKDIRDRLLARNHIANKSSFILEDINNKASPHINKPAAAIGICSNQRDNMEMDAGPSTSNSNKQRQKQQDDERGEGKSLGRREDSNEEGKKHIMLDLNLSL